MVAERGGELLDEVRPADFDGVGPKFHQVRRHLGAAHHVQGADPGLERLHHAACGSRSMTMALA